MRKNKISWYFMKLHVLCGTPWVNISIQPLISNRVRVIEFLKVYVAWETQLMVLFWTTLGVDSVYVHVDSESWSKGFADKNIQYHYHDPGPLLCKAGTTSFSVFWIYTYVSDSSVTIFSKMSKDQNFVYLNLSNGCLD